MRVGRVFGGGADQPQQPEGNEVAQPGATIGRKRVPLIVWAVALALGLNLLAWAAAFWRPNDHVVIPKGAESKPFRKVLILSGGELRFSAGLAMLATLHQRDWVPDVTIYTCGFSKIPGAYLNSLTQLEPGQPNPATWYEAALSDEYFQIMQRVKVNKEFFSRVVDKDGNTASSLLYAQMTSQIAGTQLK